MDYRPIERGPRDFQQPVTAAEIQAMCQRCFGHVHVRSAVEDGWGSYNNTYRVDIGEPVILRVAPEPARESRITRGLMRNEHASVPYLAPIAALLPRTLAVDFTHEIIDRDYLFQSMLTGVVAPERMATLPRPQWSPVFRRIGEINRQINAVRGDHFGPIRGPGHASWSDTVVAYLSDAAADLDDAGIESEDIRAIVNAAENDRALLDEITEPRLLHGDLWTTNIMVDPDASEWRITGVLDGDRTMWGDPEADRAIHMTRRKPGTERDAFWEGYGELPMTRRSLYYEAMHLATSRYELHQRGYDDRLAETNARLQAAARQLG